MLELERPEYRRKTKTEEPYKRRCFRCHGTGRCQCRSCGGSGDTITSRDVMGKPLMARCRACYGNRFTRCVSCAGVGFIT